MICPICEQLVLDSESRVTVYYENYRTCHRRCAAKKYPDIFTDHPRPDRETL